MGDVRMTLHNESEMKQRGEVLVVAMLAAG
jgi:hypothetical protein